jgi:hypothetical protein
MDSPHIRYIPRPDTTLETELYVLANVYRFILDGHAIPFWHFWHPVDWRIWRYHTPFSVLHNCARGLFFDLPLMYDEDH